MGHKSKAPPSTSFGGGLAAVQKAAGPATGFGTTTPSRVEVSGSPTRTRQFTSGGTPTSAPVTPSPESLSGRALENLSRAQEAAGSGFDIVEGRVAERPSATLTFRESRGGTSAPIVSISGARNALEGLSIADVTAGQQTVKRPEIVSIKGISAEPLLKRAGTIYGLAESRASYELGKILPESSKVESITRDLFKYTPPSGREIGVGFIKGGYEYVKEKPLTTGFTFLGGAVVGAGSSLLLSAKIASPTLIRGLGLGALGLFAGSTSIQVSLAPTRLQKGEVLGRAGVQLGAFGLGARTGSNIIKSFNVPKIVTEKSTLYAEPSTTLVPKRVEFFKLESLQEYKLPFRKQLVKVEIGGDLTSIIKTSKVTLGQLDFKTQVVGQKISSTGFADITTQRTKDLLGRDIFRSAFVSRQTIQAGRTTRIVEGAGLGLGKLVLEVRTPTGLKQVFSDIGISKSLGQRGIVKGAGVFVKRPLLETGFLDREGGISISQRLIRTPKRIQPISQNLIRDIGLKTIQQSISKSGIGFAPLKVSSKSRERGIAITGIKGMELYKTLQQPKLALKSFQGEREKQSQRELLGGLQISKQSQGQIISESQLLKQAGLQKQLQLPAQATLSLQATKSALVSRGKANPLNIQLFQGAVTPTIPRGGFSFKLPFRFEGFTYGEGRARKFKTKLTPTLAESELGIRFGRRGQKIFSGLEISRLPGTRRKTRRRRR